MAPSLPTLGADTFQGPQPGLAGAEPRSEERIHPSALPETQPGEGVRPEDRVASLLRIAGRFGTGVPLRKLHELLPSEGPGTVDALRSWLEERPSLAHVENGRAFAPTIAVTSGSEREARAEYYRKYAERLWGGPLSFAQDLVRCVGISGSTAFGEPQSGDDLDLFVVPRTGALWWFLARMYLTLRIIRRRHPAFQGPPLCLNYVLEENIARSEFASRNDPLFAREALNVAILSGEDYYRGLVASAPWMRDMFPRLYDIRSQSPGNLDPSPVPFSIRAMNLAVYPLVALYLHMGGLIRNWRERRAGSPDWCFRTETSRGRLAFPSRRFDQLREQYLESSDLRPGDEGGVGSTRVSTVR